ncbi:MAG: hypothetical protein IKG40_00830 [Bacilli bacterium]|nr:hypothetical protein [Bacilli bacterium]
MNYYNPYYFIPSYGSPGISSLLGRGFSFSSILNGAQRALGLFNQALPLIKEAAPMMRNARTMFRVMNEFKKIDSPSKRNYVSNDKDNFENFKISDDRRVFNSGGPTFFA